MVLFTSSLPTALRFAMFSKCLKCNVLWVIPYSVKIVKYNLVLCKTAQSITPSLIYGKKSRAMMTAAVTLTGKVPISTLKKKSNVSWQWLPTVS